MDASDGLEITSLKPCIMGEDIAVELGTQRTIALVKAYRGLIFGIQRDKNSVYDYSNAQIVI